MITQSIVRTLILTFLYFFTYIASKYLELQWVQFCLLYVSCYCALSS